MIRKLLISCFVVILSVAGFAQSRNIRVEVSNLPLNQVLLQLREQYDFQFSYADNQLSPYRITVSKTFSSKEEVLKFLLDGLPFQLKKTGEVFVIIPDKKKLREEQKKGQTQITGQIVEAGSFEPLPFSKIMINNHPMIADVTGNFNYTATDDSTFHVRISHLGYYIYDTLLYAGINQRFKLTPSTQILPEVLAQNNRIEKATMVGEKAGKITINHNIARFLPGQGDNSVFNLIRLMPGIQAAGEQSGDLLIWGSYEGQSLVTFDEFTIFGLKNYNDNISVVNPFLVKNIEILKGGFDAKYGNRVGGIVNITAKNGNIQKPVVSLNINPTTLNGMVEIPVLKRSSLILAYRQTYYNLYNSGDFNIFAPTRPLPNDHSKSTQHRDISFDMDVYPNDYQFRDLNLKYSYHFDNGDQFYVSMYGGGDYFSLEANANVTREMNMGMNHGNKKTTPITINLLDKEENKQFGGSVFYHKKWSDNLVSKFVITNSDFSKSQSENVNSNNTSTQSTYNKDQIDTKNSTLDNSFRTENLLTLFNGHQLEFGGGFYNNEAQIDLKTNLTDTLTINTLTKFSSRRAFVYVHDNLPIGDRLILKTGIRTNLSIDQNKVYLEPRISASYKLSEQLKFNASWGRYNQFIYKVANVDRNQNYTYLWVTGNENTPVLNATHWVSEINYFKNDLILNLQAYYKPSRNLIERVFEQRLVKGKPVDGYFSYFGDAKTYGIDLYAKKEFGKHSVWASYTLSKALERFAPANVALPDYTLAPQHQSHEFKAAGLFNIHKFYFSANYVYGSGMQILREVFKAETSNVSYNRVDAAVTYKFTPRRFTGELGLSVLNVFDTQNLRYANLKNFRLTKELGNFRVYSSSVPLTPVLFLKLVF
ncbi:MAG: TonB-dependent receptor plug domain-containing protein [Bacteroidota bacterium]|nr:TonB-dependent receptor plug domain-containing protein [Bacteroidota bacterium]